MERYIVCCYDAEEEAHFRAHRDNTTRGTAHRRFAVSINLNDDFEGGEVSFPEYGPQEFQAAARWGGGVLLLAGFYMPYRGSRAASAMPSCRSSTTTLRRRFARPIDNALATANDLQEIDMTPFPSPQRRPSTSPARHRARKFTPSPPRGISTAPRDASPTTTSAPGRWWFWCPGSATSRQELASSSRCWSRRATGSSPSTFAATANPRTGWSDFTDAAVGGDVRP